MTITRVGCGRPSTAKTYNDTTYFFSRERYEEILNFVFVFFWGGGLILIASSVGSGVEGGLLPLPPPPLWIRQ